MNPPQIPKIKIDWFAKGGVMMNPTIFGMNGGNLMGGGDAGPEAIAPISTLQKYIQDAVISANSTRRAFAMAGAGNTGADTQIVGAVQQGVVSAVQGIMNNMDWTEMIKLYVDGNELLTRLERQEEKRGSRIMDNPKFDI